MCVATWSSWKVQLLLSGYSPKKECKASALKPGSAWRASAVPSYRRLGISSIRGSGFRGKGFRGLYGLAGSLFCGRQQGCLCGILERSNCQKPRQPKDAMVHAIMKNRINGIPTSLGSAILMLTLGPYMVGMGFRCIFYCSPKGNYSDPYSQEALGVIEPLNP